jgi:hypothetical protein
MADVPHLPFIDSLTEAMAHYARFGGRLSWGPKGLMIRLPKQRRIHFYNYDESFPPQHKSPFPFTGEGYYDEHSPYWVKPED